MQEADLVSTTSVELHPEVGTRTMLDCHIFRLRALTLICDQSLGLHTSARQFYNGFPTTLVDPAYSSGSHLACLCSASSTVETISMTFPYLVNFYLQIQIPINPISMPTIYSESFGADLSENELFQCVSILLTETSTALFP